MKKTVTQEDWKTEWQGRDYVVVRTEGYHWERVKVCELLPESKQILVEFKT